MTTPLYNIPRRSIYKFGKSLICRDYYILRLSDLCPWVEKKIFKEIRHFHYITYMTMFWYNNPCPGGHVIYTIW